MTDSTSAAPAAFDAQAADYEAPRRRLIPPFDAFYGTAVAALEMLGRPPRRVLDLGAGTGLLAARVGAAHPAAELVLVDGAPAMLEQARAQLGPAITTHVADLTDPLPDGPFDAVVSALAIHHLEHVDVLELLGRIHAVLRPGGVFVNAEHVTGPTPWLGAVYRRLWRQACLDAGAQEAEIAGAEQRMEMDRSSDIVTQLGWMGAAGFLDSDCFFKQLHFAVLAGWCG
jgi:tRNA (cmo5U34)-methyltransferase